MFSLDECAHCLKYSPITVLFKREKAKARSESLESNTPLDQIPSEPDLEDEAEDDTQSIADSVIVNESSIKSIHSRQSMKFIVSKAKDRVLAPVKE